jgi:oligo-1,6-glucosidase
MNRKVLSHYDIMTVGEMPGDLNPYEATKYVAKERGEPSMVFQFSHMTLVSHTHPLSCMVSN